MPLNRSSANRAFFAQPTVHLLHRVLFGHPILGWFVIVISSGRFFSGPSGPFPCESLCVCVRFYCFCVNYITRIYHLFLDLSLSFFGKVSALLPTRTTCCPADLLKNVPLEVFFRRDFISVHSSVDRDTTNDSLALPRTAPFGFHGSPMQILSDARSHDLSPASRFTTRRLFIVVGVRNEISSFRWCFPTNTGLIHRSFTMTSSAASSLNRHTSPNCTSFLS